MGLPQERPSQKQQDLPPILSGKSAPEPMQEVPDTPKEKPMTVGGFAENALDDVYDFAKGLYNILPATIKSYQQNVPYILKNLDALKPEMLFSFDKEGGSKDQIIKGQFKGAIPETLKGILEGVKEPYVKHGGRVIYEKPFSTVADALTLWAVGVSQVRNVGKIAQAAGAGEKAERLLKAANLLEELPSKLARGAVDKGVYKLTGYDLAKERKFLHLKQEERGSEMLKLQDVAEKNIPMIDALNPQELELFHKARVGGGTVYGVADDVLNANPKVKAALEAYAPLEKYSKETALKWNRLTPEEMEQAIAKKFSLENFGDVSKANVAKAAEIIEEARKTGKRLPMYGPNVFEGKGAKAFTMDDVLQDMMTGGKTVRQGKVGAYEELKGALGYSKDPRVYTRAMVRATADVEAKSRLMDRILRDTALKTAPEGRAAEGFSSKNLPEGIHRKYYEDKIRSEALQTITDPTIKRLLNWEYVGKSNAMVAMYDKFYRLFAKMATRWNPKWVPGNIVGDAFLGALFGAEWDAARRTIKARQLPGQFLTTKGRYLNEDPLARKPNIIEGAIERYGEIANQMDAATRGGLLYRKVADKLKRVAADHAAFGETIENVLTSTQRFSDVQVGLQRIEETVARRSLTVRARDKELAVLLQREQRLAAKVEAIEMKAQLKNYQPAVENAQAVEMLRNKARAKAAEQAKVQGGFGSTPKPEQFPEWAKADKLAAEAGAAKQESILGAVGQKGFDKGMRVLDSIRQKIVNKTTERNAIVRDIMDDLIKQGELEKLVPGLQAQVDIVREGVEHANAVLPSFNNLNGFEQRVMGRIIPFYPFVKTMNMLAFRIPFMAPIKSFMWNRFQEFLMNQTTDPRLPEDFRGRVPLAVTEDGRTIWFKIAGYSPFEQLKASQFGGVPIPGMLDPLRNPVLALGYKFVGGKTVFDAGTVPYGTEAILAGDGTRVRFKQNGKLQKEMNPTPLVSGLMHLFPTVQLATSVLTPYWTNKFDWAGLPEPILNSDGSYKYPKEMIDRIGNLLGANIQTRSKEELIRSERVRATQTIKDYMKNYKRADPEERQLIKDALEDYQRGLYRHFDR